MSILSAFGRFESDAKIIGPLLAGYGELELALCNCVAMVTSNLDAVLRAMFRARGETLRIGIADALGRKPYRAHGLESEFAEAIGGMRHCLRIHNRFAHCQWYDDNIGKEIASDNAVISDLRALIAHHVNVQLLTQQERYFMYVAACLDYLNYEGRWRAGKLDHHLFDPPQEGRSTAPSSSDRTVGPYRPDAGPMGNAPTVIRHRPCGSDRRARRAGPRRRNEAAAVPAVGKKKAHQRYPPIILSGLDQLVTGRAWCACPSRTQPPSSSRIG
jgi:hypothetical protein